MSYTLYIKPTNATFASLYEQNAAAYNALPASSRQSGFDLYCDASTVDTSYSPVSVVVEQGCSARVADASGVASSFWLTPRRSIAVSGWRMANPMGLINSMSSGVILGYFDNNYFRRPSNVPEYTFPENASFMQIVAPSLQPWASIQVVTDFPAELI
jgi:hypothetical protein